MRRSTALSYSFLKMLEGVNMATEISEECTRVSEKREAIKS